MRPMPGDDDFRGRQRRPDADSSTLYHQQSSTPQMTYFLGNEESMEASLQQSNALHPAFLRQRDQDRDRAREHKKHTPPAGSSTPEPHSAVDATTTMPPPKEVPFASQDPSPPPYTSPDVPPNMVAQNDPSRPPSHPTSSLPMTPLFGVSDQGSAGSSSSSRRNSLVGSFLEDQHSHGLSAAQDDEKEPCESFMMDSGSAPQLVMPSIKMPSRRPFTEIGKGMGRLKILVAGDSGIGKTSLIKAIVQTCEHIVHVDPITPSAFSLGKPSAPKTRNAAGKSPKSDSSTTRLTEIYASTKPYPPWWSDMDDISVMRRRKSLGDSILERNLCFVDTPGYGSASSAMDTITTVVEYVETQFEKISSQTMSDGELLSLIGGDGGCQVDVVFYVITGKIKPADIEYLRLLSPYTNIIPIISQSDKLSPDELEINKEHISSQIQQAGIKPFMFCEMDQRPSSPPPTNSTVPYAVSSATGPDYDTMDASLLMSPDYVQPLVATDLSKLVGRVFSSDGTCWLRHAAARKYLTWRSEKGSSQLHRLTRRLPPPDVDLSLLSLMSPGSGGPPTSYSLARLADHTQREERLAHIRLANWSAELQRSLANERARYETLARHERAVWLTERLGECVQNGTLVPRTSSSRRAARSMKVKSGHRRRSSKMTAHQDPLGLLDVVVKLKRRGRVALEVFGSLGILGGLAFWASRNYWHVYAYEWVSEEMALLLRR
ncbi:hypothetical protein MKZ38_007839 [Zalerion maritima]|uniref:Septin-type G domain-containing protein n=1 Tax=Zalerion maritima TaxID=339359 RepID=A0AAD5WMS2_9PEZI|nr:hypothetical protein MKZ38_007839 [Zalerion maritima]